jgi:hypothetical protein
MRLCCVRFGRRSLQDELLLFLVLGLVNLAARKAFIEDVERGSARIVLPARMTAAATGRALMAHGVPFVVPACFHLSLKL